MNEATKKEPYTTCSGTHFDRELQVQVRSYKKSSFRAHKPNHDLFFPFKCKSLPYIINYYNKNFPYLLLQSFAAQEKIFLFLDIT